MDVVLVGLPGSGKSAVGRRLAHRHGATFVDLDDTIEKAAGLAIAEIFAERGEAAFRALEREAVASLGPPDRDPEIRRVVATGGGAVVDPRMQDEVKLTVIATGFDGRSQPKTPSTISDRLRPPALRALERERELVESLQGANPMVDEDLEVPSFLRKHLRDRRP